MKKSVKVTFAALLMLPLVFSGCATIGEIGDKITGIFKGDDSGSSQSAKSGKSDDKAAIKTDGQKTAKTPVASGLKTPSSYEQAYSYRTDKADKTIQTFIKSKSVDSLRVTNPDEYVRTVVAKINETATNDFEKVKLAHDAICLLVSYDAKNFWANTVPDQGWQAVVKNKTAVCEGYANLFQKYCADLKISSQKVMGYARGVGTNILTENPKESNHAWNIVQVEGCWYLIDCTWDAGYMSGKTAVQSYSTDWLFLNPEHFVCSHFPSNSKNQLIQPPLSQAEFSALPDFRPKLFELAGESLSDIKKLNECEDFFETTYSVKAGWKLTFSVSRSSGAALSNRVLSETQGVRSTTRMNFPEAGTYMVTVFYFKDGASQGSSCGQFAVKAASGNDVKYPTMYKVSSKSASIIEPKQSPLAGGSTVHFEVFVDDKNFVAVIVGKTFNQLENDGNGNFSGDVTIPKGTKQVSVSFSNSQTGKYETLAAYEVK